MFLRAGEREQLAAARTELFVVEAAIDYTGQYGKQVIFWLRGCGPEERVLALEATAIRERQVADLRQMLRGSVDAIGPYVLEHRRTRSGRTAWALVDASDSGQLSLEEQRDDG
jgi:hypothetical protein